MVLRTVLVVFGVFLFLRSYPQNVAPVFVLPNYSDTVLEADHDTCIEIRITAPEPGDTIVLWGDSELFTGDDTVAYLLQTKAIGTLQTYLCFHKVCRKVRPEPYLFTFYARDSSYDTTILHLRVRLKNSLAEELKKLPNVFTPGGDGFNDEFSLRGSKAQCASLFNVYIYNRWGELVYTNNRISFSWDGGKSPPGVYYYVITSGGGVNASGTLTLIR